jgi:hypothetical protein
MYLILTLSLPMSQKATFTHFCDLTWKTLVFFFFLIELGCLYCKQTQKALNVLKKKKNTTKLIEN